MAMKAFALDQYLKTATSGNVFAEHALDVNRWRLVCTRCGQTMTFAEQYDIADDYTNKGRLDSSVQQFAKEHAHLKPKVDVYAGTVTFEPTQIISPVAAPQDICLHSIVKHLTLKGETLQRCTKCGKIWGMGSGYSLTKETLEQATKQAQDALQSKWWAKQQVQKDEELAEQIKIKKQIELQHQLNKMKLEIMKVTMAAQSEGLNASISIPDVKPAPLPAPKEGRKFR